MSTPLPLCLHRERVKEKPKSPDYLASVLKLYWNALKPNAQTFSGKNVDCFELRNQTFFAFCIKSTPFSRINRSIHDCPKWSAETRTNQLEIAAQEFSLGGVLWDDPQDTVYRPKIVKAILSVLTYITPKSSTSLPPPSRRSITML